MRGLYNYVVEPCGDRYNNTVNIGDKSLIVNTEVFNHQYVNREATVLEVPKFIKSDIKVGDTIIVHHNLFRRWHNINGEEKNSRGFLSEGRYLVEPDQIFLCKTPGEDWRGLQGYCFVQPVKEVEKLSTESERELMGIVRYTDGTVPKDALVGFKPSSEYEFAVDGKRLYRVMSEFITIEYEYQGNEEEYNKGWAHSC